jgi:hypothetical protein
MRNGLLDQITTPASQNLLEPGAFWCADNGIYSREYPGDGQYLRWLGTLPDTGRCRFAVAPDVVADHDATLKRSWPMLRRIRETGIPVALCAQNGATADDLPWDYIDAIFLAGIVECVPCEWAPPVGELPMKLCPNGHQMTEWKTGTVAKEVSKRAVEAGKWLHMGRVNTLGRIQIAKRMRCDSVDGTYLAYGPDKNLPRLLGWLCEPIGDAAEPTLASDAGEQLRLSDMFDLIDDTKETRDA